MSYIEGNIMFPDVLKAPSGRNMTYVILKLVLIAAFSAWIYQIEMPSSLSFNANQEIAIPAIIGIVTAFLISAMALIKPVKKYIPLVVIPSDWALIGAYVYFFPDNDVFVLASIATTIALSGILHVGPLFGIITALGSVLVSGIAFANRTDVLFNLVRNNLANYLPALLVMILFLIIAIIWSNTLDEENNRSRKEVHKEVEEARKRLSDMRERTRAIADMATRLNATLNFDRILDAALDIGRLSVRSDATENLKSMALMVTTEDGYMTIESARGIQFNDMHHEFRGQEGVIAKAMELGEPIIHDGGSEDPELGVINAFIHVKSTLVIPLRANYETYGVLVFGSTGRNAINEDHIDTLAAIGVQATVALQNAVLYTNLRDEKERILRIEENGRKALVRDLHDIPTQTVSAVAMRLSTLPALVERHPERFSDEVSTIRDMALRATEEIRHVMFTLRPLSLEASGLTVALGQLSEKMTQTYNQKMDVKIDKRIENLLDKETKGTLFYLIEEAANNARKYAKASMIKVIGGIQGKEVVIKVGDNGQGFDTEAVGEGYEKRGSFGMVNMRERAELINGTFSLQSAVGKGTIITVRVPIKDENIAGSVPILKPRRPLRKQYSGPISPS